MVATLPPQKQEFVFFHGKSFYRFPVPFVFLHPFLIAEGTEDFLMSSFCLKHLKKFSKTLSKDSYYLQRDKKLLAFIKFG